MTTKYLLAADYSGSTGGNKFYHDFIQNQIENGILKDIKPDSIIRVLWDTNIDIVTKEKLKYINDRKLSCGGTDPYCVAKYIKEIDFHEVLIFVTDGQVGLSSVTMCTRLLEDWKFEDVLVFLLDTGGAIEESCSCPFTRNSAHTVKLYKNLLLDESKYVNVSQEDIELVNNINKITTIDEFVSKIPSLEKTLISVNMGSDGNVVVYDKLISLKKLLISNKSKTKSEPLEDFLNNPSVLTLKNIWNGYYGISDDWSSTIDKFISWCSGGLKNVFDRNKIGREDKSAPVPIVPTETAEIIEEPTEIGRKYEITCPITLEKSSNIVVLIKRNHRHLYDDLDKDIKNLITNCPLNVLKNQQIVEYIKNMTDCCISLEAYKDLVTHGISNESPLTRDQIFGGICLGSDPSHVKATNSTLRYALTKGKALGNVDLWFAIVYFLIENGTITHLAEYLPAFREHMVYRLKNSKSYMCLSGLSVYPVYNVPLQSALYSVIFASMISTESKTEPIRLHLSYADELMNLLKLVDIEVPSEIQTHIIRLKTMRTFLLEIKKGYEAKERLLNRIKALQFNAIETSKLWVLIDGIPSDAQIAKIYSELPNVCQTLPIADIIYIMSICDSNKAESDIYIPFNKVTSYTCQETKTWSYTKDVPEYSVAICENTCRPYSTVINNGVKQTWYESAVEIYGDRFMSVNNRFGEYVQNFQKYPSKEEFLVYLYKYYSSRGKSTLPICIQQFNDEIYSDYMYILANIDPDVFYHRWFYSRHESDRKKMEKK